MGILALLGFWIGSWILIIIINFIVAILYKADIGKYGEDYLISEMFKGACDSMLANGNELFKTGAAYFTLFTACYFIDIDILSWVAMVILVICALLPAISTFEQIKIAFGAKDKYVTCAAVTGVICGYVPMIMALNIYYSIIK